MANTYKKGMLATIGKPGMKLAQYQMTGVGTTEGLTIRASDIGLSTIMSLTINDGVDDSLIDREYRVAIGTFSHGLGCANYATVRALSAGTDTNMGTTIQIFAIGM